jgi:carbonic anhydrase
MTLNKSFTNISSGLILCFLTIPLTIGISVASGVTVNSGLIATLVGGTLVLLLSKENILVAGPSAGLVILVVTGISNFTNPQTFCLSVILSGVIQILLGITKSGDITKFIPKFVVSAIILAIGVLMVSKQSIFLFEYDKASNNFNLFSLIFIPVILFVYFSTTKYNSKIRPLNIFLIIVCFSILFIVLLNLFDKNIFLTRMNFELNLKKVFDNTIFNLHFNGIAFSKVLVLGLTLAIVSTLESLVAMETLNERKGSNNSELINLGLGNIICGLLGGLPISYVIVRSKLNELNQVKSKFPTLLATILVGISLIFFVNIIASIPLNFFSLLMVTIGILLIESQKLYFFSLLKSKHFRGIISFLATVISILVSDLLIGILIGTLFVIVGLFYDNIEANKAELKTTSLQVIKKQKKNIILVFSSLCTYFISKYKIIHYEESIINDLQIFGTIFSVATLYFWEKDDK